jgi:MFS family permease
MISLVVAFYDRLNISFALTHLGDYYGWSDDELASRGSLLLGAFYIAYAFSNLFLSPVAARFGARRSLMLLVSLFSLFTMLGAPLAFSFPLFVATRVLLGIGEGVHFPMNNAVTKRWFPLHERSRGNAIWVFGGSLAAITAPVLLVPLVHHFGFQVMLVGCGMLGLLVTMPLLYLFVHDTPRESPRTSAAEAAYIEAGLEDEPEVPVTDWSFARMPAFWLAVLGAICNNYIVFGLISWMPTYFERGKGVAYEDLWYSVPLPYIVILVAFVLYSYLGDKLNRRVLLSAVGFAGCTLGVFIGVNAEQFVITLAAFSFATFFQGAFISQEFAIIQRILPAAVVGKAVGIYNGLGILFGAVGGSLLVGQIASVTGSFDAGMLSVVAVAAMGACVLLALSRYLKY